MSERDNGSSLSCGELLVRYLQSYGIDTVFGIPGNHTVQLYRGLASSTLRHISPRHEQGAAFMADGYARASGRPAACFLISGPGLGNAVTPIMQALADSVPMLVISSVAARYELAMGEGKLHELPDQRALMAQCTRFSHTLMRPDELPKILARAFAVFDSARPGPVHLEIPLDVITEEVTAEFVTAGLAVGSLDTPRPWPRIAPPSASPAGVRELAKRLTTATAPCLVLGGGAINAAPECLALAERTGMPVVSTVNGKGIIPRGHALAVGGSPSLPSVRQLLAGADCVLAVGTEFGETDYNMLFQGELPALDWLARIDIDPAQLCRNVRADLPLCGDAGASLRLLLEMLRELPAQGAVVGEAAGDGYVHAAARVTECRERIASERHYRDDIQALFAVLQETVPELLLVGDSTLPTYYAVWQYESSAPRRYFHSATGGGTLGYAIPAAMGAKLACPEQPVVALIGDGAAQFTFMELAAAVQERIPLIVLLWNNHGYAEIKAGMKASAVEAVGVDIDAPDFIAAAKALGCRSERADSLEELRAALQAAVGAGLPSLIELPEASFLNSAAGGWYDEGTL